MIIDPPIIKIIVIIIIGGSIITWFDATFLRFKVYFPMD